jgi:hypothetical protein
MLVVRTGKFYVLLNMKSEKILHRLRHLLLFTSKNEF